MRALPSGELVYFKAGDLLPEVGVSARAERSQPSYEEQREETVVLLGFEKQFEAPIIAKTKRHTIRAKRKKRPLPGETCHCYVGLRQKGARLLGRWPCIQVQDIIITSPWGVANIWIDGHVLAPDEREALARADGFNSFAEMMQFWEGRLPFTGDIIHWNPDGYGEKPRRKRRKRSVKESTRSETDPKTDEALECSECPWRGYEEDAIRRDEPVEDWWFEYPSCGEACAHLPLDELD